MTELQKRCQELLPVIQAGAEGKVIEYMWGDEPRPLGKDHVAIQFLEGATYRIKPEPQYRPFTPEEALKHSWRFIRRKGHPEEYAFAVDKDTAFFISGRVCQGFATFELLADEYVFVDNGLPCGVKVSD